MTTWIAAGDGTEILTRERLTDLLFEGLDLAEKDGYVFSNMGIISVDHSRISGQTGPLVDDLYHADPKRVKDIFLALGNHIHHTPEQNREMFGEIPQNVFVNHNPSDVIAVGGFKRSYLERLCGTKMDFLPEVTPVELNAQFYTGMVGGKYSTAISFGPVYPHEVVGFSNGEKMRWVGIGGAVNTDEDRLAAFIDTSHAMMGLGYRMEQTIGVLDTPMRIAMNRARAEFIPGLKIIDVLTVKGTNNAGQPVVKGLFIGDDAATHRRAAALSDRLNVQRLTDLPEEVVVYLNPNEFKSFWLGNKAIYRTGMGIKPGGTLYVVAPGIESFYDDPEKEVQERLIEEVGYKGHKHVLAELKKREALRQYLGVAAHCVHGSPLEIDGTKQFNIVYLTDPSKMPEEKVRKAGYDWRDVNEVLEKVDPNWAQGYVNNFGLSQAEKIYFVPNPHVTLLRKAG